MMTNAEKDSTTMPNQPRPDQPKADGSVKPAETAPRSAPTGVQNSEPEDAYLTGGQRNLQRRVLGLNVEAGQTQRPPEQSPGLHSTGSFTGVANGETNKDASKGEGNSQPGKQG